MVAETLAHVAGRLAAHEHPPRVENGRGFRPFGINPEELWSEEYYYWNDGYKLEASAILLATGQVTIEEISSNG